VAVVATMRRCGWWDSGMPLKQIVGSCSTHGSAINASACDDGVKEVGVLTMRSLNLKCGWCTSTGLISFH